MMKYVTHFLLASFVLLCSSASWSCKVDISDRIQSCIDIGGQMLSTSCPGQVLGEFYQRLNCYNSDQMSNPHDMHPTTLCTSGIAIIPALNCPTNVEKSQIPIGPLYGACKAGSIIRLDSMTLSEIIPLVGFDFPMTYSSDRVKGRKDLYETKIHITSSSIAQMVSEQLTIQIAGKTFSQNFSFPENQFYFYEWDGKDQNGNTIFGSQMAKIVVDHIFEGVAEIAGTQYGETHIITTSPSLNPYIATPTRYNIPLGSIFDSSYGFGGWTFSVHHHYDPVRKVLYLGDGSTISQNTKPMNGENWILSSDRSELYVFNSDFKHLQTRDAITNLPIYSFTYNANGNLVSVTDKHNKQSTIQYNGLNPISVTSPYGQVTTIMTDEAGYISQVTNPGSESHNMVYSPGGLLLSFEKPSGATSTMVYDAKGKLLNDLSDEGSSSTLEYTGFEHARSLTETSTLNRTEVHNYLTNGTEYKRIINYGNGSTQSYSEDINSNYISSINSSKPSFTISNVFDSRFQLPARLPSIFNFSDVGMERTSIYSETVSLTNPNDPFSFTSLTSSWNTNGKITSNEFNPVTKVWTSTSAAGRIQTTSLNAKGDVTSTNFATFVPLQFSYTNDGKLSQITQGANRKVTFTHNNTNGLVESIKNALDQITSFTYDLSGRVLTQILPDNRVINFSYDPDGNLASVTPPGKPVHQMEYNGWGYLKHYIPPTLQEVLVPRTTYTYSNDRELELISRPDGQVAQFNYGVVTGNLDSIYLPTGTRSFKYYRGLLTESKSEDFMERYITPIGTKINVDSFSFGTTGFNVINDFNPMMDISNERISAAPIVWDLGFTYDNDSLLTQVGNQSLTRSPASGFVTQTDLGNFSQFFSYSTDFGELSKIEAVHNGNAIYEENMVRDALGRIITRSEQYGSGVVKNYIYTYDVSGRLTDVKLNSVPSSHYDYDSNSNRIGQTINGVTLSGGESSPTTQVDSEINVGNAHSCAITQDGLKCWGKGTFGQLGYGNTENLGNNETLNTIGAISLDGSAKAVQLGTNFTCALLTNGSVRCWGLNDQGQLGLGHLNNIGDNELPSDQPTVSVGGEVKKLAVGVSHACALKTDNQITCWGLGNNGRLGYGNLNIIGDDELPSTAGNIVTGATTEIIQISAGANHTCILTIDGKVKCWGGNGSRQLGQGTKVIGDNETPATIPFIAFSEPIIQMATGAQHTCVVTQSNKLKCWGQNDFGQLGLAVTTTPVPYVSTLADVDVGANVKSVHAGQDTTCVITTADEAKCWGKNENGQLGQGNLLTIGDDEHPSTIPVIALGGSVTGIETGNQHTCASLSSGAMYCWGLGLAGRLGYGNNSTIGNDELPSSVGSLGGVTLPPDAPSGNAIVYDDQDRLVKFGTKTFTYNANGDLNSETDSVTSETKTFSYDVFGNLKQVVLPNKTINYSVDAHNRRMIKKNGTTAELFYVWNSSDQLVGLMNSAGQFESRFIYASKSHVPDYMATATDEYQIVSNHLGSPVSVVNKTTGEIVQEIKYDEFGNILSDTNSGFTPFGFAGCLYDQDTKLCRFGARDYDSSIGRWLSKDPILFAGGDTNLYGYVMQDPINFIDPNGLRNTPADSGATAAYRDTFTKDFVPASQVTVIKPHQALMAMAALPAIGATASLAPLALPYLASSGLYLASNPAFVGNSLDFADSLSGELGGPTTGLPSFTYGGMAGTALGMGIKQYKNSCGP